jgi:hypothetical protein
MLRAGARKVSLLGHKFLESFVCRVSYDLLSQKIIENEVVRLISRN